MVKAFIGMLSLLSTQAMAVDQKCEARVAQAVESVGRINSGPQMQMDKVLHISTKSGIIMRFTYRVFMMDPRTNESETYKVSTFTLPDSEDCLIQKIELVRY